MGIMAPKLVKGCQLGSKMLSPISKSNSKTKADSLKRKPIEQNPFKCMMILPKSISKEHLSLVKPQTAQFKSIITFQESLRVEGSTLNLRQSNWRNFSQLTTPRC